MNDRLAPAANLPSAKRLDQAFEYASRASHHGGIDWFRDLGFLQKPGVETKAARDIATFLTQPVRPPGGGRGGPNTTGAAPATVIPKPVK